MSGCQKKRTKLGRTYKIGIPMAISAQESLEPTDDMGGQASQASAKQLSEDQRFLPKLLSNFAVIFWGKGDYANEREKLVEAMDMTSLWAGIEME